jgi:hypothetical protein
MTTFSLGPGYCSACRKWEIEHYGTLAQGNTKKQKQQHAIACQQAGCKHPAHYDDKESLTELAKQLP